MATPQFCKDLFVLRVKASCEAVDCKNQELKSKLLRLMSAVDDAYFCYLKEKHGV
jgi:predicted RNA-binding protein YlxR (DUF448 family)